MVMASSNLAPPGQVAGLFQRFVDRGGRRGAGQGGGRLGGGRRRLDRGTGGAWRGRRCHAGRQGSGGLAAQPDSLPQAGRQGEHDHGDQGQDQQRAHQAQADDQAAPGAFFGLDGAPAGWHPRPACAPGPHGEGILEGLARFQVGHFGVADQKALALLQPVRAAQALAVYHRAVGAAQVVQDVAGALPLDAGMVARHFWIGQFQIVVVGPANGQLLAQADLLDDPPAKGDDQARVQRCVNQGGFVYHPVLLCSKNWSNYQPRPDRSPGDLARPRFYANQTVSSANA